MSFMDTSKYVKKANKAPSFMDISKYKFMDVSKYQPTEKNDFISNVGDKLNDVGAAAHKVPILGNAMDIGGGLIKGGIDIVKDAIPKHTTEQNKLYSDLSKEKDRKKKLELFKNLVGTEINDTKQRATAFTSNVADSATLGLATKAKDALFNGQGTKDLETSRKLLPGVSNAGQLYGFKAPFKVAGKIVAPAVKSISNPLTKGIVKGAAEGGLFGAVDSITRGISNNNLNGKDVLASAGSMALLGAGGEFALSKLKKPASTPVVQETPTASPTETIKPIQKANIVNGKLKVTVPKLEEAKANYTSQMQKAYDTYGTKNFAEGIKKIDSTRPTNVITDMYDKNIVSKTQIAKHLSKLENRTNLSQSDYEIIDAFAPDLIQKYKITNPKDGINVFKRVQQDAGVNILGTQNKLETARQQNNLKSLGDELFKSKANLKPNLMSLESPLMKKTKINELGVKFETTSLPKSLSDMKPSDFTRLRNNLIKQSENYKYSEGTRQAIQRDINKLDNLNGIVNEGNKGLKPASQSNIPFNTNPFAETSTESSRVPNIVSGKQKKDLNPINWLHDLYTKTVDVAHPVNQLDTKGSVGTESVKTMANNSKLAQSQANNIIGHNLTDMSGQKLGEGFNAIIKKASNEDALNEYLLHKHNISRMKENKPVFGSGVTANDSMVKLKEIEAQHPEIKQVSEELDKFMKDFANSWGVGSGMADQALMDMLQQKYPSYVPVYRVGDSSFVAGKNKNYAMGPGKFIQTATGGNKDIVKPTEAIQSWINKTVKNARQNEFYNSILNEVIKDPVKMKDRGITITETGADTMAELGKIHDLESMINFEPLKSDSMNGNILTVMRNGKPISLRIQDPKVFKALQDIKTGHISNSLEVGAKKLTNPFKELITGSNPFFTVKNVFRDIPTAITNTQNNPFAYTKNLVTGIKDMATNNPMYQEYKALGGQSANLIESPMGKLSSKLNVIKKANSATETLPRYAEYKSTVEKGGNTYNSKMQGMANANDITVNFGRYGDTTKFADAFAPYLNPSVQGIDKFARQFKSRPIITALRGASVVTGPVIIANMINKDNPNYKELDNRTKDTYILIPDNSDLDENGNAKTFFKIPKSREYGVIFGALTERILRQLAGEKDAFKGFPNSVATNFVPVNPLESNIYTPKFNLDRNKDFANRTIVPNSMQDRSPKNQYDDTTTGLAKIIGDKLNYSPKKADYLLKSYTGVLYQLFAPAMTNSKEGAPNPLNKLLDSNFKSNPIYSNQATTDFYDNLDKLKQAAADKKFNNGNIIKAKDTAIKNRFDKAQTKMADINKQIKEAQTQQKVEQLRQKLIDVANKANNLLK